MERPETAVRLRRLVAALLGVAYLLAVAAFWVLGSVAWARSVDGVLSFLGILFVPILLLPVVGKGEVAGIETSSAVWWWWFGLLLALAAAAIFIAPRINGSRAEDLGAPAEENEDEAGPREAG